MTSVASNLAKLKPNVEWASLPLFDRTGWTRVRFGDVVENCAETCDPQGAELEQFITLSRGVCPRFLVSSADVEDGGILGFVEDRQPNRWLVSGRPLDSMLGMCWQVDVITGTEIDGSAFELQPSCPLQDHNPLMFILVVPEPLWRCMTMGNDPFDAQVGCFEQSGGKLVRQV